MSRKIERLQEFLKLLNLTACARCGLAASKDLTMVAAIYSVAVEEPELLTLLCECECE